MEGFNNGLIYCAVLAQQLNISAMIVRLARKQLPLLTLARNPFSSTASHGHQAHPDPTIVTAHNPDAVDDLRGFEHLDSLTETEKSYSSLHSTTYNYLSAYSFASLLPNAAAKFIGNLATDSTAALTSDDVHFPKIYPNGVPVYQSSDRLGNYLAVNKLLTRFSPLAIAVFVPEVLSSLFLYACGLYIYKSLSFDLNKHTLLKLELLPNTEELVYQKITFFGTISTKKVKISDLELVNYDELTGEKNPSERALRGYLNQNVAFKVKGTKNEYLFFDKNGIWHEDGLNHPLLV